MFCLNDVIANYDMAIRCLSSRHLENVIRFRSRIDAVFAMLSDEESKYAYGQDILFCMLSNFIPHETATAIAGNITSPEFNARVAQAKSMPKFAGIVHTESANANEYKWLDIASVFLMEQYRYKDLVTVKPGDICIDAGACLGDAALYFLEHGARQVFSFEIDRENIAAMKQTFANYGVQDKAFIREYALTNSVGEMFYTPPQTMHGGGTVGVQQNGSSYAVKTTTIDTFCQENGIHPSFIKMDIEGAEKDALEGARETIIRDRPRCAICIYHTWPHRWEIPLLLRDMAKDYRFYVKKSQPFTETVLLGVPAEG